MVSTPKFNLANWDERRRLESGEISVRQFGADGDGSTNDTAAFQATLAAWTGQIIRMPPGNYVLSELIATVPDRKTLTIIGAGADATNLLITSPNGLSFELGGFSGLQVVGATIRYAAAGQGTFGGTGLRVSAPGYQLRGGVRLHDLTFLGNEARTTAWATGMDLIGVTNADVQGIRYYAPGATTPSSTFQGVGIHLHGSSLPSFAIDNDFSNITCQGGHSGLRLSGFLQGVNVSNFRFIGGSYGVHWDADEDEFGELLSLTNGHCNAYRAGIYMRGGSQSMFNNLLFLRYSADAGEWCAVDAVDSNNLTMTGLNIYGAGTGDETGIRYICDGPTGAQPSTIIGSSIANLSGAGVKLGGSVSRTVVMGNSMNGVVAGVVSGNPGNLVANNLVNGSPT